MLSREHYCKCGCGVLIKIIDKKGRKRFWVRGHSAKRLKLPDIPTDELYELYWVKNMSSFEIGKLYKMNWQSVIRRLKKQGIAIKSYSECDRGKLHTEESLERMRHPHKQYNLSEQGRIKLINRLNKYTGNKNPFFGKHHSEKTKKKISEKNIGRHSKEKHPLWRGGISKLPYAFDFNNELKELIRKRDNYKCRNCQAPQEEFTNKLHIHHIDYNKENSNPNNLITLCPRCHSKTVHKPEIYINFYKGVI